MHVGIDLAWGPNGRTGLAAVADDGRLLDSAVVRTDAEIDAWLDALPSPSVVAVDAPIVVTNATGQRVAEREITRAWGRFHAGTHPTNLGRPYMDPPRARLLADRRGWTIDPAHPGRPELPVCLEVYPHPGMVGLFGLDRVIPYKKGPLDERADAFAELLDRMEGLPGLGLTESASWASIRTRVASARTGADLDRVEDEIDAVFCAHLAWLWARADGALVLYGDREVGAIVAPPPRDPVTEPDAEVGVGPWAGDRPDDDRLDPDLLAHGDRRNVADRYRYWSVAAIRADLDARRHGFAVAIENWQHDFNIGSIVRTANAFNARSVHVVGRRRWNRRGAMVTDRYLAVEHHDDVAALITWADAESMPVIAVDNVPEAVPVEDFLLPERCVLLFGQEGPGLSADALAGAAAVVEIPQYGSTRSINAGAAAAIVMHEWIRRHAR